MHIKDNGKRMKEKDEFHYNIIRFYLGHPGTGIPYTIPLCIATMTRWIIHSGQ